VKLHRYEPTKQRYSLFACFANYAANSLCRLARNVTLCKYCVFSKNFSLSESEKKISLTGTRCFSHSLSLSLVGLTRCEKNVISKTYYNISITVASILPRFQQLIPLLEVWFGVIVGISGRAGSGNGGTTSGLSL